MASPQAETIEAVTHSVETIAGLGGSGFILFAIFVVMFMFGFMAYIFIKSQNEHKKRHFGNEKRISILEKREIKCMDRVEKVTQELEACVDNLKETLDNKDR